MGTATAGARAGLPGRNSTSLDSTYSFDPSFHRHAAVIAYYAAEGKGVPGARRSIMLSFTKYIDSKLRWAYSAAPPLPKRWVSLLADTIF